MKKKLILSLRNLETKTKNKKVILKHVQDGGFHQTEVMAWGRLGTQERMKQLEQLIEKAEKLAIEQKFSERVRYWKEGIWNYMREGRRNYLCGES